MSLDKEIEKGDTLKCPDGHNVVIEDWNHVKAHSKKKEKVVSGFYCHVCQEPYQTRELYITQLS